MRGRRLWGRGGSGILKVAGSEAAYGGPGRARLRLFVGAERCLVGWAGASWGCRGGAGPVAFEQAPWSARWALLGVGLVQ